MTTPAVLRAAVVPTIKSTPLAPAAVACLLGCVPLLVTARHELVGALIAATVVTSFGAGFALDDTAAPVLEASPTLLWTRRALRIAMLCTVLSVGTVLQLLIATTREPDGPLPVGSWIVQHSAFVAVTLAVSAAVPLLLSERVGGAAAAPSGLVLLFLVAYVAQVRPWITPIPGAPNSDRWGYVLAAAAGMLLALSHDPGAPRVFRRRGHIARAT